MNFSRNEIIDRSANKMIAETIRKIEISEEVQESELEIIDNVIEVDFVNKKVIK